MPESTPKDREVCRGHHQHRVHAGLSRGTSWEGEPNLPWSTENEVWKTNSIQASNYFFPAERRELSIDRSERERGLGELRSPDQKWPFENAFWSLGGGGDRLSKERFSLRLIFQIKPESWLFLRFSKCKFVQNFSSFNFSSILFSRSDAQCIS